MSGIRYCPNCATEMEFIEKGHTSAGNPIVEHKPRCRCSKAVRLEACDAQIKAKKHPLQCSGWTETAKWIKSQPGGKVIQSSPTEDA